MKGETVMTNFKEMVQMMVNEANAELDIIEVNRNVNREMDALEEALSKMESSELSTLDRNIERQAQEVSQHNNFRNIMAGYDNRYMSRNDWRVASKLANRNERNLDNADYFDYLAKQFGVQNVRERKVITESYDFDFSKSVDKLPWKKTSKKDEKTVAKVKVLKSVPASTYIVEDKAVHNSTEKKFQNSTTESVIIKDFYIFKEMVILEVERTFDINTRKYRREFRADHQQDDQNFYYIFRYEPFKANGQPNPYCGFRQLMTLLKSIKAVIAAEPATLGDALRASIGSQVEMGDAPTYEYATSTTYATEKDFTDRNGKVHHTFKSKKVSYDLRTVYKFYGDITYFTENLTSKNYHEYESITECYVNA